LGNGIEYSFKIDAFHNEIAFNKKPALGRLEEAKKEYNRRFNENDLKLMKD
jgi:hypothetical protein